MRIKRKYLFILFVVVIGLVNTYFLGHLNFIERILVRFPQVLVILFIYKKYIDNPNEIKKTWKIPNEKLHWLILIAGFIELIALITIKVINYQNTANNSTLSTVNALEVIVSFLLVLPIGYFFMHYGLMLFKLNTWAFNKSKVLIFSIIIAEDVLITLLYSALA